jgi:hypothetical protein
LLAGISPVEFVYWFALFWRHRYGAQMNECRLKIFGKRDAAFGIDVG